MTTLRITAATTNPAKITAFQLLVGTHVTVVPLPFPAGHPAFAEIGDERGDTIEEIATNKALNWSRLLANNGLPSRVIASDGGLLIPALGAAWNPLRTRRFAGEGATDEERCRQLIALAHELTGDERTITWREAVAIADRGSLIGAWSATGASGRLARTIRADLLAQMPGFWIPSIWEVPAFDDRRLAELDPDEQARVDDHWSALQAPVRSALQVS